MLKKDGYITDGHDLNVQLPEGKFKILEENGYVEKPIIFGIHPEDIHSEILVKEATPNSVVKSEVVVSELLGAKAMLYTKTGETEVILKVDARFTYRPGEVIELAFNLNKAHFFDPETEQVIR